MGRQGLLTGNLSSDFDRRLLAETRHLDSARSRQSRDDLAAFDPLLPLSVAARTAALTREPSSGRHSFAGAIGQLQMVGASGSFSRSEPPRKTDILGRNLTVRRYEPDFMRIGITGDKVG
jgi:hypothetical protein